MRAILILTLASLLITGCQKPSTPDVASVKGVVTLDGQPLENATVMFQPENGRPSIGVTNNTGWYQLAYTRQVKGAMLGQHIVNIRTHAENDSGQVVTKEFLPKRYHDKTELSAEVTSGINNINFQLTSK